MSSGLIVTNTGLRFGTGLIWENGLAGPLGLTINPSGSGGSVFIQFNGTGSLTASAAQRFGSFIYFDGHGGLSVSTIQHGLSKVTFNGTGLMSVQPSGRYLTNPAVFHGTGSLSALPSGRYVTNPVTFSGSGGLSTLGGLAIQGLATFNGTGSLGLGGAIQLEANFSGANFESYFAFW